MIKRFLIVVVSLAFGFTQAGAQEDLSLSQAIEMGLKNNYNIQIEQKRVEIAENNNSWGEAGRYPSLSFSLSQNNNITDNIKTANPFSLQGISISNSVTPSLDLDWTLFNGFKINISKQRLARLEMESQGNAEIVISNTIQAIILGYYNAVLQSEQLKVMAQNMKLSRDKFKYIQLKKSYGSAVTSDILLEEGNYLTDSLNYVKQELVYRNAIRDLNTILAVEEVNKQYNFTDNLNVNMESYDFAALMNKMTNDNVDLKKQFISQSIINSERRIRQAERWPIVSMNMGGSINNSRVDFSNATFPAQPNTDFSDPLTTVTNNYSLGFRLTFNLFNGGRINRAINNAIVQEDIANLQTESIKLSLRNDLATAWDDYNIRKQIYGINLRKKEAAELNLNLSEQKFRNGTINSFDFRTIQNNYLVAAVEELRSRYQLMEADIGLMRLTGGIIETYRK